MPLSAVRQRELVLSIRESVAKRDLTNPTVACERVHVAAANGDHAAAVAAARACLERWPRARTAVTLLAAELLFLGQDEEALAHARRARRMPGNWAQEDAVAAAAELVGGDRDEAARICERARRRILSCGYTTQEYTLLQAAVAALAGDHVALDAARQVKSLHYDTKSLLWEKLSQRMGEPTRGTTSS